MCETASCFFGYESCTCNHYKSSDGVVLMCAVRPVSEPLWPEACQRRCFLFRPSFLQQFAIQMVCSCMTGQHSIAGRSCPSSNRNSVMQCTGYCNDSAGIFDHVCCSASHCRYALHHSHRVTYFKVVANNFLQVPLNSVCTACLCIVACLISPIKLPD